METLNQIITEKAIKIIYEGWLQYRTEIKGYRSTPTEIDIQDWEAWKKTIFNMPDWKSETIIDEKV